MKKYDAPMLTVDLYTGDTIYTSGGANPKNANAGNNQNCWGCKNEAGELDPGNPENACGYLPGTAAYDAFC